jgi:beta-glucosidase
VSLTVRNTGDVAGREVVQLYVRDVESTVFRPYKELKGFEKVLLQPGEEKQVEFILDARSFAFYNTKIADWHIEGGVFELLIGASSADIRLKGSVFVEAEAAPMPDLPQSSVYFDILRAKDGISDEDFTALYDRKLPENRMLPGEPYTINSTLGDLRATFTGKVLNKMVLILLNKMMGGEVGEGMRRMALRMVRDMPLRSLVMMSNGSFSRASAVSLLQIMNRQRMRGMLGLIKAMRKRKQ